MKRVLDSGYIDVVEFHGGSWGEVFREAAQYLDDELLYPLSVSVDFTPPQGSDEYMYRLLLIGE